MTAASNPNTLVDNLAIGGMVSIMVWGLINWVRDSPITPDPWDAETDKKLSEPEIEQACHHCSMPQTGDTWFCPHCGSAVGPYNNVMPYLDNFSVGEVLRNGLNGKVRLTPFTIAGYLIFSLTQYVIFAPIYWFLLFKNMEQNKKDGAGHTPSGGK